MSWQKLQVAPHDLARIAGYGSTAWQSGDGLRAVTYALILLLIGIVAASLAFTWPTGLQETVVGIALLVAATRLTAIAVRVLLAPDCPRLRLLPLDDATAWQVRRIAVGLAAIVAGGSLLRSLCDGPLAAPGLGFIVSLVAGLGIFGFALGGIRLWSAELNIIERRRVVPAASTVLPFLATAAVVAGVYDQSRDAR